MPHFTLQLSPGEGPVVLAYVSVSLARASALKAAKQPVPNPVQIRALVDTGASNTCVDPTVVEQLSLSPTGSIPMCTPSTGTSPFVAAQYDVSLLVPGNSPAEPMLSIATMPVTATDFRSLQKIDALIGRDVLAICFLAYNGPMNQFTIAY